MQFNGKELTAIVKNAIAMAAADGRFAEEEKAAIILELAQFGVSKEQAALMLINAEQMDAVEALAVISSMDLMQKKYVTGFLAAIMAADGDIDDSEMKVWSLISALANLPTMTMFEALDFWKNH